MNIHLSLIVSFQPCVELLYYPGCNLSLPYESWDRLQCPCNPECRIDSDRVIKKWMDGILVENTVVISLIAVSIGSVSTPGRFTPGGVKQRSARTSGF